MCPLLAHSPSGPFGDCHEKKTWIDSLEVEVRSEHSSTWGDDHMSSLILETRTGFGQQRQESSSPSSSPIRALVNPDDEVATGSSKSTGDHTSSDSSLSRGNTGDSNMDTASGDCLSCSDTDEVSVWTN